jgi:hypothetical protein
MRTFALLSLFVSLAPVAVHAQAAPVQAPPVRVIEPAPAPAPVVMTPAPGVVAPAPAPVLVPTPNAQPVYVQQQPVYVQPQPVYAQPVYAQPVYAQPPAAAPLPPPSNGAPLMPAPEYQLTPPGQQPAPPGYGYGYGAPPAPGTNPYLEPSYAARRGMLFSQLDQVDGRLHELKSERPGLGGPIAMMAVGYGVALFSGVVAAASFGVAEAIEHDTFHPNDDVDINDDGSVDGSDERAARNTARVFTGFAVIGLGVGIGGTAMLAKRSHQRKENGPEIKDLKRRRQEIKRELKYDASVTPQAAQVTVRGRF